MWSDLGPSLLPEQQIALRLHLVLIWCSFGASRTRRCQGTVLVQNRGLTPHKGYLVKYKARIVVQGDLQLKTDKETYTATLAARIFCLLIALTAYFNLEAY